MKIFEQFKKSKPIAQDSEFVNVYKFALDDKEYKIIIPKKTANRHSILHCTDDYIAWEQAPLFPRLVGRSYGLRKPIYKFDTDKNYVTIFVIKGKPNGVTGLDDGIFKSVRKFDPKFINVMNYKSFKKL